MSNIGSTARNLFRALIAVCLFGTGLATGRLFFSNSPQPLEVNDDGTPIDYKAIWKETIAGQLREAFPMELYTMANIAALLEQGQLDEARERTRMNMLGRAVALRVQATNYQINTGFNEGALRAVSTYYARVPDPQLDAETAKWLEQFTPHTQAELAKSKCEDGICRLVRQPATRPNH